MSDKNRNMNDINDQKTAEQQAFSEEIRRRLAEPGSGKPTLDEFKVMVYKDREKRRKKRNALVACIVAAFIVGYLTYDDLVPEVGADKNPKETIKTEDGVIIEDGGYGSSEEADNVWVTENWEQVEDAKKIFPQLLVPEYIPEGYSFDRLIVKNVTKGSIESNFLYLNSGEDQRLEISMFITEGGNEATNISEVSTIIKSSIGEIYIQRDNKMATIQIDDGIVINIWHGLLDDELVRVVENIGH